MSTGNIANATINISDFIKMCMDEILPHSFEMRYTLGDKRAGVFVEVTQASVGIRRGLKKYFLTDPDGNIIVMPKGDPSLVWGKYEQHGEIMEESKFICPNCGSRRLRIGKVELYDKFGDRVRESFDTVSECADCGNRRDKNWYIYKHVCVHLGKVPINSFSCLDCGENPSMCRCFVSSGFFCEECDRDIEEDDSAIRKYYIYKPGDGYVKRK